jgi:hypothetical protein
LDPKRRRTGREREIITEESEAVEETESNPIFTAELRESLV